MKPAIKIVAALVAFFTAAFFIWLFYPSAGVPILAYHRVINDSEVYSVDPSDFEKQMRYLKEQGYTAISLSQLFDALDGNSALPTKPIVITFDDGYRDNYLNALPILEKYGMKATVFVLAGAVGQSEYLTWDEIKAMQRRNIEIGSHTMTHAALSGLSAERQLAEIRDSKALLEERLGVPIQFLAYPYGKYNSDTVKILAQEGYRGACSGAAGLNFGKDNAFVLKRINIPRPKYGLWEFKVRLMRAEIYGKLKR